MRTLYLRNVPDDVAERLEQLARREGMSLSAFAVRELSGASLRANNPRLLEGLPNLGIEADDVVAGIDEERSKR